MPHAIIWAVKRNNKNRTPVASTGRQHTVIADAGFIRTSERTIPYIDAWGDEHPRYREVWKDSVGNKVYENYTGNYDYYGDQAGYAHIMQSAKKHPNVFDIETLENARDCAATGDQWYYIETAYWEDRLK